MIKKFFATLSFLTFITTVSNADETAIQKCMYILENVKPDMQRKAAIHFNDCVRKKTTTLKVKGFDTAGAKEPIKRLDKAVDKAMSKISKILPKQMTKDERLEKKAEKKRIREEKNLAKKKQREIKKAERAAKIQEAKDKLKNIFKKKEKN